MAKVIPMRPELPSERRGWAFYALFCDACAVGDFVRSEDAVASSCGHATAHEDIAFCARCAIIDRACRRCGASLAAKFAAAAKANRTRNKKKRTTRRR